MTETGPLLLRKWPIMPWGLAFVAIVACYVILAFLIPPGPDTLWRLHIAQGLWDGKTLYRDLIEVNPPLWFWGAMPAAAFGGYPALVAINLVAALIGVAVFGALARLTASPTASITAALGLLAGLLLVSVGEIGQREQAFLLACALWSGLASARIDGKAIPAWLGVIATIFAAYGFALKHYFVLVPIIIEALVLWQTKNAWRPLRLETILLAGLAGLYAVAVLYLTPDFLGRVLGLVQASYFGFGPWNSLGPIERQLRLMVVCAFGVIPLIALFLTRDKTPLIRILVTVLVVSLGIFVMQQKGWRYHRIGANGLAIVIMALLWQSIDSTRAAGVTKCFVPLGLAVLAWTAIVQPAISSLKTENQPINPVLSGIIANEPKSHHIAILSTAPENAFYTGARAGRAHWSRHYSMWMMPGLLTPVKDRKKEALRLLERARVLKEFTEDLTCLPPNVIVGEVGYFRNPEPRLFDAMTFLREDAGFANWMDTHYRRQADVDTYPIWRLIGLKPEPSNCPTPR